MFTIDCSPDPDVHRACSRIANRVVFLIRPVLRTCEDRDFALCEAYAIAREEMERHESAAAPAKLVHDGRPQGTGADQGAGTSQVVATGRAWKDVMVAIRGFLLSAARSWTDGTA